MPGSTSQAGAQSLSVDGGLQSECLRYYKCKKCFYFYKDILKIYLNIIFMINIFQILFMHIYFSSTICQPCPNGPKFDVLPTFDEIRGRQSRR